MVDLHKVETLLGIDCGLRRTGVCIGNTLTKTTSPLDTIHHKSSQDFLDQVGPIIQSWQPRLIVVGYPIGNEMMMKYCKSTALSMEESYCIACVLHEENLSSWEAESYLKQQIRIAKSNKDLIDKVSAQIILQSFINEHLN
ncbi:MULTISPECIES: Holliday junction resolvase RuvX [Candidatus Ichthyocystis]|uniref:Holliday junction resolvase RuvX n=1 Tax=Candidatus Ichthyocystis TaxID=2929841 RepID=UPI000B88C3C7|nr:MULTISPECIES: Holliday junction resolvase RuvX [Ichthyocystis]